MVNNIGQSRPKISKYSPQGSPHHPHDISSRIIKVRMESHLSITRRIANRIAEESYMLGLNLKIESFVCLEKKDKGSFTVIKGPHVHKKSRDQYHIPRYVAWFTLCLRHPPLEQSLRHGLEFLNAIKKEYPEIEFTFSGSEASI